MADFFSKIDKTIMGRKTAAATAKMRESGDIPETPSMANYVVSRRWKAGKRDGFEVVSGSLKAFMRKLKRRRGERPISGRWGRIGPQFPARGFGGRALHRTWSHTFERWRPRVSGQVSAARRGGRSADNRELIFFPTIGRLFPRKHLKSQIDGEGVREGIGRE